MGSDSESIYSDRRSAHTMKSVHSSDVDFRNLDDSNQKTKTDDETIVRIITSTVHQN